MNGELLLLVAIDRLRFGLRLLAANRGYDVMRRSSSLAASAVRSGMSVAKGSFLMVLLAVCGLAIDDALTCFLGAMTSSASFR